MACGGAQGDAVATKGRAILCREADLSARDGRSHRSADSTEEGAVIGVGAGVDAGRALGHDTDSFTAYFISSRKGNFAISLIFCIGDDALQGGGTDGTALGYGVAGVAFISPDGRSTDIGNSRAASKGDLCRAVIFGVCNESAAAKAQG